MERHIAFPLSPWETFPCACHWHKLVKALRNVNLSNGLCKRGIKLKSFDHFLKFKVIKQLQKLQVATTGQLLEMLHIPGDILKAGKTLLKILVNESAFPTIAFGDSENATSSDSDNKKCKHCQVLSTPAVRSLAKQHGIHINEVTETGKDGRVLKEDVVNHAAKKGVIEDPSVSLNADTGEQPQVAEGSNCDVMAKFESPTKDRIVPIR